MNAIETKDLTKRYKDKTAVDKLCLTVREGDMISLRGKGKGRIAAIGGTSRKGRLFISGEVFV